MWGILHMHNSEFLLVEYNPLNDRKQDKTLLKHNHIEGSHYESLYFILSLWDGKNLPWCVLAVSYTVLHCFSASISGVQVENKALFVSDS